MADLERLYSGRLRWHEADARRHVLLHLLTSVVLAVLLVEGLHRRDGCGITIAGVGFVANAGAVVRWWRHARGLRRNRRTPAR